MTTDVAVQPARTARPGVRWIPLLAASIIGPLLLLALVEFGLRIAEVGYDPSLLVSCSVQGAPASCYNLFFAAPFFPAGMVQTPRLYSIPATKPPNTYRIFVLGESAAMGDPDSAYGFSRYLEVMLRQRFPATNFEIVNTGSVAINSHVSLQVAKGLAGQHPDLFIVYSGNNEVVGPYGPGTVLSSSAMSMPVIRAGIFLRSTRTGQLLTRLGTVKQEWRGMEMFLDKQVSASSPLMARAYSNFEENLRDTVSVAREAGAKVIVATVVTNLRDCAPFASAHRAGLSQEDLRSWEALVQQGKELEATDPANALKRYQDAAKMDDQYAELEFRMARVSLRLGDTDGAQKHFVRARDLDTLRFRVDSHLNQVNRSAGAWSADVAMVDAEKILSDASPGGTVGSEFVYDHVHLTPEGNYLLAKSIFREVTRQLPMPAAGDSEALSEVECERLLALTQYDRARLAADMLGRLQKPPFTNQLNHEEQIFRWGMQAQQVNETPDQTNLEYRWAIEQRPDDKMLRLKYAMFLYRYDRAAAAQELVLAQPWDGYPMFFPDGTQIR